MKLNTERLILQLLESGKEYGRSHRFAAKPYVLFRHKNRCTLLAVATRHKKTELETALRRRTRNIQKTGHNQPASVHIYITTALAFGVFARTQALASRPARRAAANVLRQFEQPAYCITNEAK